MSWKDRLRPASWRGVPFGVRESSRTGGRRVGVHEYPLRDEPLVEDLGRVPVRYSVDAYIVGDNYAAVRDQLIARLEEPGPGFPFRPAGTLIHPTFGRVRAICTSFRELESTDEGRMARIAMEFVEAGSELQPESSTRHVDAVEAAGFAAETQAAADFEAEVTVTGVVERARTPLSVGLRTLVDRIENLDVFGGPASKVAALTDALRSITLRTSELVSAPADLAALVVSAMDAVLDSAGSVLGALSAYEALFVFPPSVTPGTGFMSLTANENSRLLSDLVRVGAAAGAARAASRTSFATLEDAVAARERISELLDELVEGASTQGGFALEALRHELVVAVPPPGATLPRLETITLPRNRPALVLAFQRYDDPHRDVEIVERNRVRVPLRVPGGRALEVLTR